MIELLHHLGDEPPEQVEVVASVFCTGKVHKWILPKPPTPGATFCVAVIDHELDTMYYSARAK